MVKISWIKNPGKPTIQDAPRLMIMPDTLRMASCILLSRLLSSSSMVCRESGKLARILSESLSSSGSRKTVIIFRKPGSLLLNHIDEAASKEPDDDKNDCIAQKQTYNRNERPADFPSGRDRTDQRCQQRSHYKTNQKGSKHGEQIPQNEKNNSCDQYKINKVNDKSSSNFSFI